MVGHKGQIHIGFQHLRAMNSDIVGLMTLKCSNSQLALVNMDVMENPPPVPVRRQKY